MPSKREHRKSRLGCAQCKQRRIKCDECAPCCGPCSKKGLECDYRHLDGVQEKIRILTQASFAASSSTTASFPSSTGDISPSPEAFSPADMLLMHHFTLHTSRTIGALDEEDYHSIWQTVVPVLACRYPFLMHAVLSITAAHRSGIEMSRRHCGQAIRLFTGSHDQASDVERSDAVFCYCRLMTIITFTLECKEAWNPANPVAGVNEFIGVTRTAASMLSGSELEFRQREVGRLLRHTHISSTDQAAEDVTFSLNRLDCVIASEDEPYSAEDDKALQDAMLSLRQLFTYVDPRPATWANLLHWPVGLSSHYLALLQQSNFAALAIFSHWCVPMHNAPQRWYIGNWPKDVIVAIARKLDGSVWQQTLDWPTSEIKKLEQT